MRILAELEMNGGSNLIFVKRTGASEQPLASSYQSCRNGLQIDI